MTKGKKSTPRATAMGKEQAIEAMKAVGLTNKQADQAYEAFMAGIDKTLRDGGTVRLKNIGSLTVRSYAQRNGVKPGTGEKIVIPAGKRIRFKQSSTAKV